MPSRKTARKKVPAKKLEAVAFPVVSEPKPEVKEELAAVEAPESTKPVYSAWQLRHMATRR